ncbi:MAG: LysE family translocator [Bacteroidales bacterium]|jgi:threonine/homoserine/homoserine lactone efflux protein|nr:LysE family translocator [Bacteroidales bacterium]
MFLQLLKGFIVGIAASIPLGPLGILCVQKTLSKGRNSGFITGLGASVSDTFYAGISLIGLAFIQNFVKEYKTSVMIIGGIIVILIGLKIYYTNPIKQIRQKNSKRKHAEDFLEAFIMTITNPGSIVLMIGVMAAVGVDVSDDQAKSLILTTLWGVFLGSVTWWFILSSTITLFRKRFRIKQLVTTNRISGIIIMALGLISAFGGLVDILLKFLHQKI